MKARVAAAVSGVWLLVGLVWGSHTTFGANLQGSPVPFGQATTTALINSLPWIPATLAIIALTIRFPIRRDTWWRNGLIHLAAFPIVAFLANILVVLGFWLWAGSFQGFEALMRGGLFWTSLRIHIAAVLYVVIAAGTQSIRHYWGSQARELRIARLEGQLARARLDALNAQLRPHFLFNTLHTIGQLWRSGRAQEADRLLDHLGALFERVQSITSEPEVPLAEELDTVSEYLAIEQARFGDRLQVSMDVPIEVRSLFVPPLVLQPLIENAIRHGISRSSKSGRIRVAARTDGRQLVVDVEDDGPGLTRDRSSRGTGTGHSNLRLRLEELYGDAGDLIVSTGPNGGYTASVAMPVRTEANGDPQP